jgi:hypothetical protein
LENYYAACYWRDRKEDATACTAKVVNCLQALAKCDESFENVHAVPKEYKLPYRITPDFETIRSIVEAGRNREDVRPFKVIEKLGFRRAFVSDSRKPAEQWALSFCCGLYANTPGLLNSCVLNLPETGNDREKLLNYNKVLCVMKTLIEAWNPDWAVFQSTSFREVIREKPNIPGRALVGWMVYFASHLGKVPDDLRVYSRMELNQKGTLLILSPDPISSERPDHIEAAKKLITSLQSAGLIPA